MQCRLCLLALLLCSVSLITAACRRRASPPQPYLAFVADHGSHSIAVVNLATFRLLRVVPLSFAPERIVLRPHSNDLFITSRQGKLAIVHSPALSVMKTLDAGRGLVDVAFAPDGRRAYVLDGSDGNLIFFDCAQERVLKVVPLHAPLTHIAVLTNDGVMVGEDALESKLLFLDPVTGRELGALDPGRQPGPMAVLSRKIFVADQGEDAVTAIDTASRQVLSHIEIGAPPSLLALKPDGGEIFVFSPADSMVTILDASHDSIEQSLPTGSNPADAVFTADSNVLYIANTGDGTVTTLDVQNRTVKAATKVGIAPCSLALTPDERFLAVADEAGDDLAIVEAQSSSLLTVIPVGGNPVDVMVPGWVWKP